MQLPLVALRKQETTDQYLCSSTKTKLRINWEKACKTPQFSSWKGLSSTDKMKFHQIAQSLSDIGIVVKSPYKLIPIERLLDMNNYSVEHVVPRFNINGRGPGAAENDPRGWMTADRHTNSRRGNMPLALWPDPKGGPYVQMSIAEVDGVKHFFPPESMRATLARKWLFLRFNYRCIDVFEPPSTAQINRARDICAFAKMNISVQEIEMNKRMKEQYGVTNPLIDDTNWLDNEQFRYECFN